MKITQNWLEILKDEFAKSYFLSLQNILKEEYSKFTIYPQAENVFNALNYCKFENVKVVIVGQDPYHEPNQAIGLSFAVPDGEKLPPSLQNIFKEIEADLNITCKKSGDLRRWAVQGVLLLNSVLTVRRGLANSHKNIGWEEFTRAVVKKISDQKEKVVFVLWGNNAKSFLPFIDKTKHLVLTSAHPSPLSAYNGFFGCKHFSKINTYLEENNKAPINWE